MKNFFSRLWDAITAPFVSIAILIDESQRQNLDGSWDSYWAKRNCKSELRNLKLEYKRSKNSIKAQWRVEK